MISDVSAAQQGYRLFVLYRDDNGERVIWAADFAPDLGEYVARCINASPLSDQGAVCSSGTASSTA